MPSSTYKALPFILQEIIKTQPKSILDIGIGFDMEKGKNSGKQINWHEKYPVQQSDNVYNTFIKNFQWAAPIIKRRGIRVINLYRNSGLKMFPFDDLENVI